MDGLVYAIDCCPTAESFETLKYELIEVIEQHVPELIEDPAQFADDLFYNNGLSFLKKNFK